MRRSRPTRNLTNELELVVQDLCTRLPEFAHVDPRRLLLCVTRARTLSRGGTFAKIVPMRFPTGTPLQTVNGKLFTLPQIPTPHGDILYLIYIFVPRFFEQSFESRLLTVMHELYHIAPEFDGTIRRFGTRAHGSSRERFNLSLHPLIDRYLLAAPPAELLDILHTDLKTLAKEAELVGRALPVPKAIRLS